jgi:hypothetical protein
LDVMMGLYKELLGSSLGGYLTNGGELDRRKLQVRG